MRDQPARYVPGGFTANFLHDRIQILGETELTYLRSLSDAEARRAIDTLFQFQLVCIIVTKKIDPPAYLLERSNARHVPVFRTPQSTTPFLHSLTEYLTVYFAPRDSLHASLVDVYGVGLLFTGRSGIGKSETALDCVERGHRLVADDVVEVFKKGEDVIIGSGRKLLEHCMEIRGIGIIDVREIFGIRAIRIQKRPRWWCARGMAQRSRLRSPRPGRETPHPGRPHPDGRHPDLSGRTSRCSRGGVGSTTCCGPAASAPPELQAGCCEQRSTPISRVPAERR